MTRTRWPTTPTVVQRILDHIDNKTTDLERGELARAGRELSLAGALRGRAAIVLRRVPDRVLPVGGAAGDRDRSSPATPRGTPIFAVRGSDGGCAPSATPAAIAARSSSAGAAARRRSSAATTAGRTASTARSATCRTSTAFPVSTRARAGSCRCATTERHGLVFVTQDASRRSTTPQLEELPPLIAPERPARRKRPSSEVPVNWKIFVEGVPRGLPHPLDAPADVLPRAVRQPERRRDGSAGTAASRFPYRAINKLRARAAGGALGRRQAHVRLPPLPERHGGDVPGEHLHGRDRAAGDRPHALVTLHHWRAATSRRRAGARDDAGAAAGASRLDARRRRRRRGPRGRAAPSSAASRAAPTSSSSSAASKGAIGHFHRTLHAALDGARAAVTPRTRAKRSAVGPQRGRRHRRRRRARASCTPPPRCSSAAATGLGVGRRDRRRAPASPPARSTGTSRRRPSSSSRCSAPSSEREIVRDARRPRRPSGLAPTRFEAVVATYARRALHNRRLAWALVYEPRRCRWSTPSASSTGANYCSGMAALIREGIAAGEIPAAGRRSRRRRGRRRDRRDARRPAVAGRRATPSEEEIVAAIVRVLPAGHRAARRAAGRRTVKPGARRSSSAAASAAWRSPPRLQRLGLPFVLLERAPELGEVGSGLGILPGAVRALRDARRRRRALRARGAVPRASSSAQPPAASSRR